MNHIDAVQIRRAEITYFFTNVIAILDNSKPIENDEFFGKMNIWGTAFLESTGGAIGRDLAFYAVNMN